MLKCQFHTHAAGDPVDDISHSPKELIKTAAKNGYDVLAITCHRKIVFTKEMAKYARRKGILLLPSLELEINKMHVLCINVDSDIYNVDSFEALKEYKLSHPDCLIIAPHPFFPGSVCLKKNLTNNLDIFDAVENSFCYTRLIDFNKKARTLNKPLVATSDCHILEHLDLGYTLVNSKKNIPSIFKAIKNNQIKAIHSPLSTIKLLKILFQMFTMNLSKKLLHREKAPILEPILHS